MIVSCASIHVACVLGKWSTGMGGKGSGWVAGNSGEKGHLSGRPRMHRVIIPEDAWFPMDRAQVGPATNMEIQQSEGKT